MNMLLTIIVTFFAGMEKKEDIYFKLFNPSSIIRNTAYEE